METTQRQIRVLLILIVGTVILAACYPVRPTQTPVTDDPIADRSFSTNLPCAPPCWYGLEINQATKADAYDVISELPFIDQKSVREHRDVWEDDNMARQIVFECVYPTTGTCGKLLFSGNRLKQIYIAPGYSLTFQEAVQKLGEPAFIRSYKNSVDLGGCVVDLFWPELGIGMGRLAVNLDRVCSAIDKNEGLIPDELITAIFYQEIESSLNYDWEECCQPWPGFKEVSQK